MLGDGSAKRAALFRIAGARVAARANEPRRAGGDRVPALIEREHGDLEAFAWTPDHVLLRHFDFFHLEEAGIAGEDAPFFLQRAARKALETPFDDERAQARWIPLALLFEVRPAKHEEVVRDVGERDPHLLARHDVAVPALDRDGLNTAHVASGRRRGQAIRRELSPLCLRDEIPLFLILGPP